MDTDCPLKRTRNGFAHGASILPVDQSLPVDIEVTELSAPGNACTVLAVRIPLRDSRAHHERGQSVTET